MALYTTLRLWLRQLFTSLAQLASTTADTLIDYLLSESATAYVPADSAANANTTAQHFFRVPTGQAREVVSIYLLPNSTLTADSSNYVTLTAEKEDGAAGGKTTVATLVTSATSWATGVPVAFTLSTTKANLLLDAGEVLSWKAVKAGTGVSIPLSYIHAEMRKY